MPIRPKVFLSLLVTALIPVLILGIFAYTTAVNALRNQILGEVENFAFVQAQRMADLISHQRSQLGLVCTRTQLRLLLESHLEIPNESSVERMERILSDAKAPLQSFESISVTGLDGIVIASTDPSLRDTAAPDPENLKMAIAGEFIHGFHAAQDSRTTEIVVMGPLKIEGRIIGAVVVVLRPTELIATLSTDPASTVESDTYLVKVMPDDSLQILVPSEAAGKPLNIQVSEGGQPLMTAKNRTLPEAVDAGGTAVIVAECAIPTSDLAVVVSVPRDRALQPARSLRNASLGILAAAFAFAAFVAFVLARSISDPIHALAETANRVATESDLHEDADENAPGEIGNLARSFNRMTGRLLRANRELEKALAEQSGELKSAQLGLIQAERMESLGRLAAGVAHEVKNPLAIIQMGVDFLKNGGDPNEEDMREMVEGMDKAVAKADSIIHGMLDLTRSHGLVRKLTDANQIVDHALELAGYELKKRKIKVVRDLGELLPEVRVDQTKFEQVFINIIINAAHAMSEGGKLYVKTYHAILNDAERKQGIRHFDRLRSKDGVVIFEFRDTGPGISEDKLQKIFEPFYTTKAPGEGTGLGLGIAKTIVDLHHGDLQADNHPDGGARFRILLKVSDGGSTSITTRADNKEANSRQAPTGVRREKTSK